jgi:uncharacterized protein YjbI with pentapeptide repeats
MRWGGGMEREEAIKLIRGGPEGVAEWNRRREAGEEIPDLSDAYLSWADLSDANLSGAKLFKADLSGAKLFKANLSGANLSGANFSQADLSQADLSDAYLVDADLSGAKLIQANLVDTILSEANFSGANLSGADLSGANLTLGTLSDANLTSASLNDAHLSGANLFKAHLSGAYLDKASLSRANLSEARLMKADLSKADLSGADLSGANLRGANLSQATLRGANLSQAIIVDVDLRGAKLSECQVFGISVWKVLTDDQTEQNNLIISDRSDPVLTVDNLKVAQFIYLLLNNVEIRGVIDTITSKVVLILGRFTPERKVLLDGIREELRRRDYLPVMFDFEKPASRGYTETITTLARMARFIIADVTDAAEVRVELAKIVPDLPSVPVRPLVLASVTEYVTFDDIRRYPWVLEPFRYTDLDHAIASLQEIVLAPAEAKLNQQRR